MTTLKKPVKRVTNVPLGGFFGPDRHRRIVVTLIPGNGKDVPDLIEMRPEGTRRPEKLAVIDVYRMAIRSRVNAGVLEKARAKKAKKDERRARAKMMREINAENRKYRAEANG